MKGLSKAMCAAAAVAFWAAAEAASVINPTPQQMVPSGDGSVLDASRGFCVTGFANAPLLPAGDKGAPVEVRYGKEEAAKAGVAERSGAYALAITPQGAIVTGYDEAGAFYGLQSLSQLAEAAEGGAIGCVTINDWPTLPRRGVVEGFYGEPWSHEVRLSLIDFFGKNKMNTYVYGPKDDPYHRSPNWRLPYPAEQAAKIRELVDRCAANYVDFVWAIHPGLDIKWDEEDYQNLLGKFEAMYALGVRSFAIFFDDIKGEGTDPNKQVALLNRLMREFVEAKGDVRSLTMCPTDYSRLWANPGEDGALAIYGRTLDPGIGVMYTGDVVCSDLTEDTMEFLNSRIRRPGFYWWNFPVSDYCRNHILLGPAYGLDTTLTDKQVTAFVSNPMEHGEASKLALYGVADYGWNVAAYDALANWERSLKRMMPEAADAFRTFAIHSADTEKGYRRDESWETETFDIDSCTPQQVEALRKEFEAIAKAPATIESNCTNAQLLTELKPWLDQCAKLGERGLRTIALIEMLGSASEAELRAAYEATVMTAEEVEAYNAHKVGSLKLQPFCEKAMADIAARIGK